MTEVKSHSRLDQLTLTETRGSIPGHVDENPPVEPASTTSAPAKSPSRWWKAFGLKVRVADGIVIALVLVATFFTLFGADSSSRNYADWQTTYGWIALGIGVLWMLDLEVGRSRDHKVFGSGALEYRRVIQSTLRVFGFVAIVMVIFKIDVSRGFFALALPVGLAILLTTRWVLRRWLAKQRQSDRAMSGAVVMGSVADVEFVVAALRSHLEVGYRVSGIVLTDPETLSSAKKDWMQVPVIFSPLEIADFVALTGADVVVVAGQLPDGPEAIQQLGWRLEDTSTELVLASSLTNIAGPRVHFRPVEGLPLMHVELPQYSGLRHVVKRAMDIVLASIALFILLPVLFVLGCVVRLDTRGPVLFRQERVGRNGRTFKMLKLRSMVVDAEARLGELTDSNQGAGVLFKMVDDPRVTRSGKWMRRFSLDELPQFWNVLVGDMSLVGPRPPLLSEVAGYEKPERRRLLIKPGITGLWQVNGRSDLAWDESVRLDLYYVENWSLTGDFIILWRTFKAVYEPAGAY